MKEEAAARPAASIILAKFRDPTRLKKLLPPPLSASPPAPSKSEREERRASFPCAPLPPSSLSLSLSPARLIVTLDNNVSGGGGRGENR